MQARLLGSDAQAGGVEGWKMINPLSKEQALLISAYTGFLCVKDFSDMHAYCEKVLGRSIWTHQFTDEGLQKELREKLKPEFLKLIP